MPFKDDFISTLRNVGVLPVSETNEGITDREFMNIREASMAELKKEKQMMKKKTDLIDE